MTELIENVIKWAKDRGILTANNAWPQYAKVNEEAAEIGQALANKDIAELEDAIGDTTVTLIILAEQNGLDFKQCLQVAYNTIKDRKGRTINGQFHKN